MTLFNKGIDTETQNLQYEIDNEFLRLDEDELLNKRIDDVKEYYYKKYSYEELPIIMFDNPYLEEEPVVERDYTSFDIYIPLEGDCCSLKYEPVSQAVLCHNYGAIVDEEKNVLKISVSVKNCSNIDVDALIEKTINDKRRNIERQYSYLKADISKYNKRIELYINQEIDKLYQKLKLKMELQEKTKKSKYLKIIPKETEPIKIEEKVIETLKEIKPQSVNAEREHYLKLEEKSYLQIYNTLIELSVYAQRLPKSYLKLDEEDIRDQIVNALNLKLKTATATGETFNVNGKTDIIIIDNKLIYFIAECKIWKGAKKFLEAIEQLLSYVSEDVFYTSLIIFNKNKNKIIDEANELMRTHNDYIEQIDVNRLIFKHPKNKKYKLEISLIVFDIGIDKVN